MSVRLRLRRTGARNKPCYRIVAADQRSPRDGRFIEILGLYDPRHQDEKINLERAEHWLKVGAQPSETVMSIIKRARAGKSFRPDPKPAIERLIPLVEGAEGEQPPAAKPATDTAKVGAAAEAAAAPPAQDAPAPAAEAPAEPPAKKAPEAEPAVAAAAEPADESTPETEAPQD